MKPTLPFFALLGSLAFATASHAESFDNLYVSGAIGITNTDDADYTDATSGGDISLDNDVNVTFAIGTNITENIRGELELSYRQPDADTLTINGTGSFTAAGDVETTAVLLNGYYDFMPNETFSPYVSAGLGVAQHDADVSAGGTSLISDDDTVFAYQLGAGVNVAVADDISLFGGYRYFATEDASFANNTDVEYAAHELRVGVRYSF